MPRLFSKPCFTTPFFTCNDNTVQRLNKQNNRHELTGRYAGQT